MIFELILAKSITDLGDAVPIATEPLDVIRSLSLPAVSNVNVSGPSNPNLVFVSPACTNQVGIVTSPSLTIDPAVILSNV